MTQFRQVDGLIWAKKANFAPFPPSRGRGAKANGRRFENNLGKVLDSSWKHGVWFEFRDKNGPGYAQPDFFSLKRDKLVILEVKYTWTKLANDQINKLYKPILELIYGLPVFGVVVVKKLTLEAPISNIFGDLSNAIEHSGNKVPIWQWIGDINSANTGERS